MSNIIAFLLHSSRTHSNQVKCNFFDRKKAHSRCYAIGNKNRVINLQKTEINKPIKQFEQNKNKQTNEYLECS